MKAPVHHFGFVATIKTRPPGGQTKNRLHVPCGHGTGPTYPNVGPIDQSKSILWYRKLELRITHIRCYNEKVEVLASLGPQQKKTT